MDKKSFIKVLHHFSGSSVEEAQAISALVHQYPYSQLLHALSARVSKDHGFSNHSLALQLAAVYASDRGVLKDIITATEDGGSIVIKKNIPVTAPIKTEQINSGNLAEDVLHDLKTLGRSKHNFEVVMANYEGHAAEEKANQKALANPPIEDPIEKIAHELKETPGLSKKQRIVALAKAADALAEAEAKEKKEQEASEPQKKKKTRATY